MKKCITCFLAIMLLCVPVFTASGEDMFGKSKPQAQENLDSISAIDLYQAFKENKADPYTKRMRMTGTATYVGPDVFGLPSVELSENADASGRVLCVLPFGDYLKLRKVSKKDELVVEGDVRGFADKYDIVVVKECVIVQINGEKL